jgi:hypothetical protein
MFYKKRISLTQGHIAGWVLVAHNCNHSYSGGRDQEDNGSKPAWANSSTRSYLEKPFTKIGMVEWP